MGNYQLDSANESVMAEQKSNECCVGSIYSNWCKDYPIIDHEGQYYCMFHLPENADISDLDKVDFSNKVEEYILNCMRNLRECDLRGTVFRFDIWFNNFNDKRPLPDIYFNDSKFLRHVSFYGTRFGGKVIFDNVVFRSTDFISAIFYKPVSFEFAVFYEDIEFYGHTFRMEVVFRNVILKERSKAVFRNMDITEIRFIGTDIQNIDFINCKFYEKKIRGKIVMDEEDITLKRIESHWGDVGRIYRVLKTRAIKDRDPIMASEWHYNEKEMERKMFKRKLLSLHLA